jgi:Concanavalin A-like lectin/glucanases superfamily
MGPWKLRQGVRRTRARPWTALSLSLVSALIVSLIVVPQAQADALFSDGFESGNFGAWSSVKTGADGTATVQSATVKTGTYAARLTATATAGSLAYARESLASAQTDLVTTGDFQVQTQGSSGANVPLFRLLDASGTKIVSLYRQNVSGRIEVSYAGAYNPSSVSLGLNTWAQVELHVIATGTATGTVDVAVNGTTVYHSAAATLPAAGISSVQIGNNTASQTFAVVADNISVTSGAAGTATPPSNTAPPTISGTATEGSTLSASPGTWSGTTPISYAYQWRRCDSAGTNCSDISGATGSNYTVASADVGGTLKVTVTASNAAGSGTSTSNATNVVQSSPPPPGLRALWHMNETSGSVMYDSVGGHNGTLRSVLLGQPGYSGTAYGFNGTSSYVSVPSSSDLNPGSSNITITLRLKTTSAPASPDWDLIRKGLYTSSGGEFKMEYQPTAQVSCGFKGSSGYAEMTAGPSLKDGNWHTVHCVKTSTAIKVVVDGQTFSKTANIGSITPTDSVVIGARPGSEFFKGTLDEASIEIG